MTEPRIKVYAYFPYNRWLVQCTCGWTTEEIIYRDEAGAATNADARALGEAHLERHKEPAMPRRMQANPKYSLYGHGREHDETPGCALGTPCTPVADTVAVPATGTFVVADGVVHAAVVSGASVTEWPRYNTWTVDVEKPKPTFFEEGKTYRWRDYTFTPERIDSHSDGKRVAYGQQRSPSGWTDWVTKGEYTFESWTEEA